jgi:uncharacterized protein YcfJ
MRTMMLALAATSMTIPATAVIAPTAAVAKQSRYYSGRTWYDNQGRVRCRRPNGTTGLLIGGVGGALVGRAIDTHGSRVTGTVLGAAAGALIGRSIDRNRTRNHYYCR